MGTGKLRHPDTQWPKCLRRCRMWLVKNFTPIQWEQQKVILKLRVWVFGEWHRNRNWWMKILQWRVANDTVFCAAKVIFCLCFLCALNFFKAFPLRLHRGDCVKGKRYVWRVDSWVRLLVLCVTWWWRRCVLWGEDQWLFDLWGGVSICIPHTSRVSLQSCLICPRNKQNNNND